MKQILFLIAGFLFSSVSQAQFVAYNQANSPIAGNTCWFTKQHNNKVYVSTNQGLSVFDVNNNSWTNYNTSNSAIGSNDLHGLAFDNNGNLWIATYTNGLCMFDGINFVKYNTNNSLIPVNQLYHITYDSNTNKLWIGTRYGYLVSFAISTSTFTTFASAQGLYDSVIDDVDVDSSGNVWVACRYSGVAKFDGNSFVYYTAADGLAGNDIYSISVAPDGKIWAGATTGLSVFDGALWTNYNTSNSSLSGNYIRQIEFHGGNIWIGSGGGGIQKFDGATTWTTYKTSNSNIPNDSIWSMSIDSNSTVWAASFGRGLLRMNQVHHDSDSCHARIAHFPIVNPVITAIETITKSNKKLVSIQDKMLFIHEAGLKMNVYTSSGKLVKNVDISTLSTYDISLFEKGVYILEFINTLEEKQILKLVNW